MRTGLPSLVMIVGVIELRGALPGAMAFASPWTNPVNVGGTWVWREIVHLVIHQHACT